MQLQRERPSLRCAEALREFHLSLQPINVYKTALPSVNRMLKPSGDLGAVAALGRPCDFL